MCFMENLKRLLVISFICIIISINTCYSQSKPFGIGIILGAPTGLSAKYWTSVINAFDFGLGYSFEKNSHFHLHGDYLFHNNAPINSSEKISIYYGPGMRLKLQGDNKSRLGVRGVLGGLWMPRVTSIDVFVEIAPVMDLIPATKFSFDGGLGVRFFLN